MAVAASAPDRFRALVIGNSWAWPVNGDAHFERFSRLFGSRVGRFAIRRLNAFVNLLLPLGTRKVRLSRAVMDAYRRPFAAAAGREPTAVMAGEILRSERFLREVEQGLPRLSQLPALILWGDRDIAFRSRELARFEAAFPRHRTVILAGAGHFIQEDDAEGIVAGITAWWDGSEGQLRAD